MIPFALAVVTDSDGLNAAIQALTDAFASGDIVMASVAAVLAAIVIGLKFFGKKVPFIDAGVKVVLDIVKKAFGGKIVAPGVKAVVTPVVDGAVKPSEGIGSVVQVKKDE